MKTTVNERVTMIRTSLKLSQSEFASKAGLTQVGVWGIESDGAAPRKTTLEKIINAFNVNREWLLHGTGEMFLPGQSAESIPVSESVWKDEAYQALKEEVKYLREMLKLAMTGTKSFPNDIIGAGLINSFEKFGNVVRA